MTNRADTIVRAKIDVGLLPVDEPVKTWAGYGSTRNCSACELPILGTQVEYEVEYAADNGNPCCLRFHIDCHGVWSAECLRRRQPAPQ